jgi:hypothetical protein
MDGESPKPTVITHPPFVKYVSIPLGLLCAALSACTTITPLQSKPPYAQISVNKPFTWGDGIWFIRVNMPAGTYTPKYEDEDGFYYEAPEKITGRDSWMALLLDGGLYLEKNKSRPEKIYIIRNQSGVPGKVNIGNRADLTMHREPVKKKRTNADDGPIFY